MTLDRQSNEAVVVINQNLKYADEIKQKLIELSAGSSKNVMLAKTILPICFIAALLIFAKKIMTFYAGIVPFYGHYLAAATLLSVCLYLLFCAGQSFQNMGFFSSIADYRNRADSVIGRLTKVRAFASNSNKLMEIGQKNLWNVVIPTVDDPTAELNHISEAISAMERRESGVLQFFVSFAYYVSAYLMAAAIVIPLIDLWGGLLGGAAGWLWAGLSIIAGPTYCNYKFLLCRMKKPSLSSVWIILFSGIAGGAAVALVMGILGLAGYLIYIIIKGVITVVKWLIWLVVIGVGAAVVGGIFGGG